MSQPNQNPDVRPWPFMGVHGENNLSYRGITVVTREIGDNPNDHHGDDFSAIRRRGRIPIVRVNYGYGERGTIPPPYKYNRFAERFQNYVRASTGATIWVVGNEPNHSQERPKHDDGTRPPIWPHLYARCYDMCRDVVHATSGHENDVVLLAGISPWNNETVYDGNELGNWIGYYTDVQLACETIDGFDWHAYGREQIPDAITRRVVMDPPFAGLCWGFKVFEDWAAATLNKYKGLPTYITELNAYNPWQDKNTGYIQQAAGTINRWNIEHAEHQIRGLACYRWAVDKWTWGTLVNVKRDFLMACDLGYEAGLPDSDPDPKPEDPEPDKPKTKVWAFKLELVGTGVNQATIEGTVTYNAN